MKSCPRHDCPLISKSRSPEQHRRVFAIIEAAFHSWPEDADFQPTCSEQLRAYLLVKTGHYDLTVLDPEVFGLSVIRPSKFSFAFPKAGKIQIYTPRSIAWDKLDQRAFAPIASAIDAAIEQYLGVTTEKLLEEFKREVA